MILLEKYQITTDRDENFLTKGSWVTGHKNKKVKKFRRGGIIIEISFKLSIKPRRGDIKLFY